MKYNYHTHTARCHHAVGIDEEFVLAAIEAGYEEIGFSDHCAWPYTDFVSGMRMTEEEIEGYVNSVKALREKYKDKIKIKLGWECEYVEEYLPWLKEIIRKYDFDYVILGHHFSPSENSGVYSGCILTAQEIENYKNDVLKALESGVYSYVAHPDIYMKIYPHFDEHAEKAAREIIAKAIETKTPLEYNLLGLSNGKKDGREGYPYSAFWKLAGEMGATAIVGIDAHFPDAFFWDELRDEAFETLKKYGLKTVSTI